MKQILILSAALMIIIHSSKAQIIRVNNNTNIDADYSSLQAAIDAASSGDTIYIEPSTFTYGNITIPKKLILIGPGYLLNENTGLQNDPRGAMVGTVLISDGNGNAHTPGVILMGLELGQLSIHEQVVINRCKLNSGNIFYHVDASGSIFNQCFMLGSVIGSATNVSNVTLTNNIFTYSALTIGSLVGGSTITNNIFHKTGSTNAIFGTNVDGNTIKNNIYINATLIADAKSNDVSNNLGITTEEIPTYFVAEGTTDGKWKFAEDSPAIGAGELGIDLGAFGGVNPYILSGVPPIPRISNVVIPTTGSSTEGLPIQITIQSQN